MNIAKNKCRNLSIRGLTRKDLDVAIQMDEESGNALTQWIEDLEEEDESDYGFGAFLNEELIGYCSIGYADDVGASIDNHPLHTSDSLYLSDVYVKPPYRKNGYALQMIETSLALANPQNEAVFLTVLYDNLEHLYNKLGFEFIDDSGNMVRDSRALELDLRDKREELDLD